jgi:hypothetical protein
LDGWGPRRAPPFAASVFRFNSVGRAGLTKPPELARAQTLDAILRRYPGYTLTTLLAEDARELMQMMALLDPDLGKADDGE